MIYPPDALSATLHTTGAGTTCGTLLATSTDPYTLLAGYILSDSNLAADITIGSSTVYLENHGGLGEAYITAPVIFQNQAVICHRGSNQGAQFTIIYVPRALSATSTIEYTHINDQPLSVISTSTITNLDTSRLSINTSYFVIILIILATILLFDLLRRLFAPKKRF